MIEWDTFGMALLIFIGGCASLIVKAWIRYGLTYISYVALYCWLGSLGFFAYVLNQSGHVWVFWLCLVSIGLCATMLHLKLRDYFRAHWRFFSHSPESLR